MLEKAARQALEFCRSSIDVARTVLAQRGLDRRYRKVFLIGFNKTATTSIYTLFLSAGLHTLREIAWRQTDDLRIHYRYRAFTDGPPDDFTVLDRHFPRSQFILNTRDLDEWIDSRLEHIRVTLGPGEDASRPFWCISDNAVKAWIGHRNQVHLQIMKYFEARPRDLLIVNYIRDPEAARRIRRFLGLADDDAKPFTRPIPKTRDAGVLRNREMIERCYESRGIPASERKTDLYCPSLVSDPDWLRFPYDTTQIA